MQTKRKDRILKLLAAVLTVTVLLNQKELLAYASGKTGADMQQKECQEERETDSDSKETKIKEETVKTEKEIRTEPEAQKGIMSDEEESKVETDGVDNTENISDVQKDVKSTEPSVEENANIQEEETRVIEVSDLASFSNAVSLVTSEDDLTPAYEFTKDSAAAVIGGEEEQLSTPAAESGDSYVVPKEVFAEDDAVSSDKITDGDGMVSLDTVAEVSDYEVEQQGDTAALVNPFQNKHLIVKSEEGFDPQGAVNIIQGYDHLFVLTYRTEEETKAAYEYLQTIPYLTVEADSPYSANTQTADAEEAETVTADNHAKTAKLPESRDIVIAVLDSGYDIKGCGMERIVNGTDVTGKGDIQDENGHGTAMANIILENTHDCIKVMPVKVADADGRTSALKLYLGLRYAIENHADVINISMSAYKASNSEMMNAVIREAKAAGIHVVVSAGNAGDDVMNYSPANVEEAIVVSAVNVDDTLMAYSNRGDTIDYSAYGKVQTTGLNKETAEYGGTSVSAAIVSAVIGGWKAFDNDISYDEMISLLDRNAKDLGEEGKDSLYGKGLLSLDMLKAVEDENPKTEVPELLTCDWKNLSDEELNYLIAEADEFYQKRFLDRLTEDEKKELLARNVMFNNDHVSITYDKNGNETSRNVETLYQYLYSEEFNEYITQYYVYHANMTAKVLVNTKYEDTGKTTAFAAVKVYSPGIATQPADDETYKKGVKVSGTSGGEVDVKNIFLGNFKTFTDDNGNPNTIGQYEIKGLKFNKEKGCHVHMIKNDKGAYSYGGTWWGKKYTPPAGGWTGGFVTPSDLSGKSCSSESVTGGVMVGEWDFVAKDSDNKDTNQEYTLFYQKGSISTDKGEWKETKASCLREGSREKTDKMTCSKCGASYSKKETKKIPRLSHNYVTYYDVNNNIANGVRWEQCSYNCGGNDVNGEYWKRNYQYLQQVFYRYMDENGNYPEYSTASNDYYTPGAVVRGYKYTDDGSTNYQSAGIDNYICLRYAGQTYIDIPRKQYSVVFHGNGATGGSTPAMTNICCGKTFSLNANGFVRTGYDFIGWSASADGAVTYTDRKKITGSLSLTNGATVNLYAKWEPHVYTILLDNQGVDVDGGDDTVYEKYAVGYYQNKTASKDFPNNQIIIPEKWVNDDKVSGGKRKQQFLGYYTGKNGAGYQMVKGDGSLIPNINHAGSYKYFTSNATVYANWENMFAIQFSDNMTDADMEIIGKGASGLPAANPVICPETKWKAKGESITINYEASTVTNTSFTDIYRLKGWSLTPEISSDDEIILSDEKGTYTFTEDRDVILYAQWDTSFNVTYVGNEQSEGMDYLDPVQDVKDAYTFSPNDEEEVALLQNDTADYFVKTIEKPTVDVATGEMQDENGEVCTETVAYSFQGWSMFSEKSKQDEFPWAEYAVEDGKLKSDAIILTGEQVSGEEPGKGLTFGEPVDDYGSYNAAHDVSKKLIAGTKGKSADEYTMMDVVKSYAAQVTKMPFVNMYAIWDQYPQIAANDLYFPLTYAQDGTLTEEYLLNLAVATDEELKSDTNPEGRMKNGEDTQNQTAFTLLDYQTSEFVGAEGDIAMTITYRAEDSVGNVTTKMVTVHLVDTTAQEFDSGSVRFISEEYMDTLSENSIWRAGEYAAKLAQVLGNHKSGEEYTQPTLLQQAIGAQSVKKPGSGTWDHVEQVWEFTHEQVLEVQDYVENHDLAGSQGGFLSKFGSCRVL